MFDCHVAVFIEEEKGYSYEEKKKLLSQIVALEEYLQQGIPIVSRFLAEYLCMSDMSEFQEEIFKMVEWVTFRSYEGTSVPLLLSQHHVPCQIYL